MRDGRPNPDIWGNIITCGEIAVGIYEIVGTKKRGLEVPKALAEECGLAPISSAPGIWENRYEEDHQNGDAGHRRLPCPALFGAGN